MRVLLLARNADLPEAGLFRGLRDAGISFHLTGDLRSPYVATLQKEGFNVEHIEYRSRIDFHAALRLRRLMRTGRFDLFHAFDNRPLTNGLLASFGLPIRKIGYCGTLGHLRRWDPAGRLSTLNPRLDAVVCLSKAVQEYLISMGVPRRKTVVIHKGQDPAWFVAAPSAPLSAFGIPNGAFVVGCAANMRPVKGVDVLLKAGMKLPQNGFIHFLLIGEVRDPGISRLAADPALRSIVHLTGWRADAPALLGQCHAVAAPSLHSEGFCKAVTEALAQGVPAVVSNVGGLPEQVLHGQTGLVVPPGDPSALAEAIQFLADHPDDCRRMGAAARHSVETRLHIRETVAATIRLYKNLLAGRPLE